MQLPSGNTALELPLSLCARSARKRTIGFFSIAAQTTQMGERVYCSCTCIGLQNKHNLQKATAADALSLRVD